MRGLFQRYIPTCMQIYDIHMYGLHRKQSSFEKNNNSFYFINLIPLNKYNIPHIKYFFDPLLVGLIVIKGNLQYIQVLNE
jgi:hypothetical protein